MEKIMQYLTLVFACLFCVVKFKTPESFFIFSAPVIQKIATHKISRKMTNFAPFQKTPRNLNTWS